jgi:DNA-binding transcriptional regulator YiaG
MTTGANLCTVPRRSAHQIELSDEERSKLERTAGLLKAPFREVQRARIILYAAEGLTDAEIARRLDCTPDTVAKWRRRFCEERLDGLRDQPRAGRPRRFPPGGGSAGQGGGLRAAVRGLPALTPLGG